MYGLGFFLALAPGPLSGLVGFTLGSALSRVSLGVLAAPSALRELSSALPALSLSCALLEKKLRSSSGSSGCARLSARTADMACLFCCEGSTLSLRWQVLAHSRGPDVTGPLVRCAPLRVLIWSSPVPSRAGVSGPPGSRREVVWSSHVDPSRLVPVSLAPAGKLA